MLNPQLKDKFLELLGKEWFKRMESYLNGDDFSKLYLELFKERRQYTIYPEKGSELLFKAFRTTPISKVKVVILGQDPYHDGSYDGFAFSNDENRLRLSPSLVNIFKEVESDVFDGFQLNPDPQLIRWAEQGVLLINTAHTVRAGEPASHILLWMEFTRVVIHHLLNRYNPTVWMLWGAKAKRHLSEKKIGSKHLVLTAAHPSPFSANAGFFGCKHFSQANEFLLNNNVEPINW
jgi:uracil-DNA glycosylase